MTGHEQLCFLSSAMLVPDIPRGSGFGHRIQDDEELAHSDRHRHFLRFPSREQPLVESFDDWVSTRGGAYGHIQDGADLSAPTAEMARARPLAAIIVERGDPHQLRDFALVERA